MSVSEDGPKSVCHNHNNIHCRGLVLRIFPLYGKNKTAMFKFPFLLLCSWTDGTEVQEINFATLNAAV